MKKFMIFLISLCLAGYVVAGGNSVYCSSTQTEVNIVMVYRGAENLNFEYLQTDNPPFLENHTTWIPLRAVAEILGFFVEWNGEKETVKLYENNKTIEITIGSVMVSINSETRVIEFAPKIVSDRTFVPLSCISELIAEKVECITGIDEKQYIWISSIDLLNNEDVAVDDENYYRMDDKIPLYYLKADGMTARKIRIGDSYETVLERYGEVHDIYLNSDGTFSVYYFTSAFPASDSGSRLIFCFDKDNRVSEILLDGGF